MDLALGANPLLLLAIILVVGTGLGWLARKLGLPGVSGQIVAGFLLSHTGLRLFDADAVRGLQPLTHFALGLIGVTVGAHLNLSRLRNAGRRLSLLLLTEAVITPLVVISCVLAVGESLTLATLLGTLAISTAPATVIALVRETRSRGVFVKTLLAAVALNNMACIILFELARSVSRMGLLGEGSMVNAEPGLLGPALEALARLLLAFVIGAGAALLANALTRQVFRPERLASVAAISILLTFGLSASTGVSPLLACLALGAFQTNLNPERDRLVDAVFANFEPAILCIFFTLAGMHLSFDGAGEVGIVALVLILARILGKYLASESAMRMAGATDKVRRSLRIGLIPQAGVAIGLVILIQEDPAFAGIADLFVTVVLLAVTVNEIVGPIMTRFALARSAEVGQDRPRLVDFIQEENIVTNLHAHEFEDAIRKLTELLVSSHQLHGVDRDTLLQSILEREAQVSTCIGGGLAVPHGELPEGSRMVGVMGLSQRGLDFETPDGRPVQCIVLLATPRGERDRHLEVLAALARMLGADTVMQQRLFTAESPAHASEILHGEEAEDFNYFLEAEDGG